MGLESRRDAEQIKGEMRDESVLSGIRGFSVSGCGIF